VSRRQSDWVQCLSTDWAWKANGKEKRADIQKTIVCYKLFTWVRQCMSLEAQEHFTWEDSMWMTETPYPTWLFLTLPPGSIKDTRSWQWQWHRVNMSMTHIKVTWRVESSVLRISGESQGWWPMYIIQGTCKVETGGWLSEVSWGKMAMKSHLNQLNWALSNVPVIPVKSDFWRCWSGSGPRRCETLNSNANNTKETTIKKPYLLKKS
jgi:hypothetical protein